VTFWGISIGDCASSARAEHWGGRSKNPTPISNGSQSACMAAPLKLLVIILTFQIVFTTRKHPDILNSIIRSRSSLVHTLPITKINKQTVVAEAPENTCAAFALENLLQKAVVDSTICQYGGPPLLLTSHYYIRTVIAFRSFSTSRRIIFLLIHQPHPPPIFCFPSSS